MVKKNILNIYGRDITVYSFNTAIVGTGCAAYNAADSLYNLGQKDIALITEGINMGTSRNTGSDKQTYYKLSLSSSTSDSVFNMAKSLYDGQSVNGDTALVEAALSTCCFFKLVNLGVPFPHDIYGQYVGYKTDHDPLQRATSCGPLTSKKMVEYLEKEVMKKNIDIFDGYRVISIITDNNIEKNSVGLLAISRKNSSDNNGLILFNCTNVIYATGGPSGLYYRSVYPVSQTCGHGAALKAGVKSVNVTEWQYGISSTKFRWNLSGSYQQVIPRYLSTDKDKNDPREFLIDYFSEGKKMLDAIFLKGYQWPFDPRKTGKNGSSIVDIAVYIETILKKRRVFLDYTKNSDYSGKNDIFDFSLLSEEAYKYLSNSNCTFGTPIERLKKMNNPAYMLYLNNNIDLEKEWLEIGVCAQHNNGGLKGDMWWQSNIAHFFPVGEVCGNFGVYRPGGSALNATQVGSMRAAQYISHRASETPIALETFKSISEKFIADFYDKYDKLNIPNPDRRTPLDLRKHYQEEMDECAGFIRKDHKISEQIKKIKYYLTNIFYETLVKSHTDLINTLINYDILITQYVYLSGMLQYIKDGGESRGSFLVDKNDISYDEIKEKGISAHLDNGKRQDIIQEIQMSNNFDLNIVNVKRRPLPNDNSWFELIYNDYLNDKIIGKK